jgi:protein tyrosine phosphatase (PTP) superfamily phosphohydrolase (DUF442 family)/uncharacterized membrane protein YkoI
MSRREHEETAMRSKRTFSTSLPMRAAVAAVAFLSIVSVQTVGGAQQQRERVPGVSNFGRVTDKYFRGGALTPEGVRNLYAMGVRTIVNLRDEPSPEEAAEAKRLGIAYHTFPMTTHATPDPAKIERVLSIIRSAGEPVYVHCSAGKHRAGTVCALYRMRDQGWSPERAWAEQSSYGFGPPEEHPELYAFAYGQGARPAEALASAKAAPAETSRGATQPQGAKAARRDDDDDDSDDDDDDADEDADDRDEDDDDDGDRDSDGDRAADRTKDRDRRERHRGDRREESGAVATVAVAEAASAAPVAALSASHKYVGLEEAVRRARPSGGAGDVLKIDLEYDPVRKLTTWDVTFASGTEVELDAATGDVLGSKQKPAAKLAVLAPLGPDAAFARALKSFADIITAAETAGGRAVLEMELKRVAGRDDVLYEVAYDDGTTTYFDAKSGAPIAGF